MARRRFIDPAFWTDPDIARLSPVERLFFLGCVSHADDEGRLPGSPAFLRNAIFPYDEISLDEVRAIRDRVAATCRNLVLYRVDGQEYLALLKWARYQKPKYPRPSRLPPPARADTDPEGSIGEALPQNGGNAGEGLPPNGGNAGERLPQNVGNVGESLPQNGGNTGESLPQNGGNVGEEFPQNSSVDLGMGKGMGLGTGMGNGESDKPLPEKEGVVPEGGGVGEGTKPAADAAYSPCGAGISCPGDKPDEPGNDATVLERSILRELRLVPGYPFDFGKDLRYVRDLAVAFPELDLLAEAQKWRTYKLDKPLTPKSNPRLQFRHWCEIAVRRGKIRGPTGGSIGGRTRPDRQDTVPDWERRFYGEG